MRAALAALLAAFVAGCGFHLAGSLPLPQVLQRVYLDLEQPYKVSDAPLEIALRERLVQRGARVVSKSEKAETRLRLWNLAERREALSIGPDGKALEYRLLISVDYEVRRGAELLLPPTTQSSPAASSPRRPRRPSCASTSRASWPNCCCCGWRSACATCPRRPPALPRWCRR